VNLLLKSNMVLQNLANGNLRKFRTCIEMKFPFLLALWKRTKNLLHYRLKQTYYATDVKQLQELSSLYSGSYSHLVTTASLRAIFINGILY